MAKPADNNNNLFIQLLSYDKPTKTVERFYFSEMSTLQAMTLLPQSTKMIRCEVVAYTSEDKYVDQNVLADFKTSGDFNNFFLTDSDYHIHNCEMEFENEIIIGSHDDGEVTIQFSGKSLGNDLVNSIFRKNNLDLSLIDFLKTRPGHYIVIDRNGKVIKDFEKFEDYIKSKKNKLS